MSSKRKCVDCYLDHFVNVKSANFVKYTRATECVMVEREKGDGSVRSEMKVSNIITCTIYRLRSEHFDLPLRMLAGHDVELMLWRTFCYR